MKAPRYYRLDAEQRPVRDRDVIRWAVWYEAADRKVDLTEITPTLHVSTIFLGLDHRHFGEGPPLLFETMVFDHDETVHCVRYASWDDAATGHKAMVRRLRTKKTPGGAGRVTDRLREC